jgi:tetratricopeptide (TPR) repeat protein
MREAEVANKQRQKLDDGIHNFNIKRWDAALTDLQSLKADECSAEENNEAAYYLGLCFTKLGRYDDALLYLEQVVTQGADQLREYQCRQTLAYIYSITDRGRMAEFELTRLIQAGFQSVQIYAMLAYAAWDRKKLNEAIQYYEKALELDEENTTALNGLGYLLADSGLDYLRALDYCRKAVQLSPRSAAYLDSLGWAYYKNGELPEAKAYLRQALDLAPGEKTIANHMKAVLQDMGA